MRSARQLIPLFLKPLEYLVVLLVTITILAAVFGYQALVLSPALAGVIDRLSTFSTIFLGIFIEAVPFLLLGTLASGLVEVYVRQDDFKRLVPHNVLGAALFGGVMGLFFPVCECGVIPLTRRLFHKGLPTAAGIAFLLASPVVNPIVIASTMAAFGLGRVLYLRVGITLLIAVSTGLIFALQKDSNQILRPVEIPVAVQLPPEITPGTRPGQISGNRARLQQALTITVDEFFEMGRYLVMGALLAALLQTLLPQNALETIGQGPILSVLVMMALAVLLSICSTVDAFIALSFAATFSPGAIVAFLVFGPMVDIKSVFMYLRVFRKRSVFYLVVLPFVMALLAGILINFYSI
jgi:uncharacterized membrane protein YraQ (UPF0718 family)